MQATSDIFMYLYAFVIHTQKSIFFRNAFQNLTHTNTYFVRHVFQQRDISDMNGCDVIADLLEKHADDD